MDSKTISEIVQRSKTLRNTAKKAKKFVQILVDTREVKKTFEMNTWIHKRWDILEKIARLFCKIYWYYYADIDYLKMHKNIAGQKIIIDGGKSSHG